MGWLRNNRRKVVTGIVLGVIFLLLIFFAPRRLQEIIFLIVGALIFTEVSQQLLRKGRTIGSAVLATALMLLVVVGVIGLISILQHERSALMLLSIALIVVATDTGAQVVGQLYGQKGTFFPKLSPNKSRAGVFGGLTIGIFAAAMCGFIPVWGTLWPLLYALPPLAVAGDLLESATKRSLGIKDFGGYIPDTGGLTDRADSWLPVLALVGFVI